MSTRALDWARDGRDWPNRDASRFVKAAGLAWHVQVSGSGPTLLLVHGTGASTHSWRDLLPRLSQRFTVVAPDLPGHGFTDADTPRRMSMAGMAASMAALLVRLDVAPKLVVGHSAGAAVLAWMTLEQLIAPAGIVGLNGAFLPIGGAGRALFPTLARLLAASGTAAELFAMWAGSGLNTEAVIAQTGSRLDAHGAALYRRLAGNPVHVGAALTMMAHWDLQRLEPRLPSLGVPLALIVGTRDGSVPPSDAKTLQRRLPFVTVDRLRGLGHLAHEEAPAPTADLILRHATAWGVLPS